MSKFSLTAQIQLKAPTNTAQVVNQIKNNLQQAATVQINFSNLSQVQKQLKSVTKQTKAATTQTNNLAASIGKAAKRYLAFAAAGRALSFLGGLKRATDEAIEFEAQITRVAQVTGKTAKSLQGLRNDITALSTSLGVASSELSQVAVTLSQAGFQAADLGSALRAIAKTNLAATFTDIRKTTEGAIAIFNQFGGSASALEQKLGAINAVAGRFAVESDDIIDAVRRTGGVFKTAGGTLEEFIALFTSVRATTRESAESIATGLRTILTRIQRPKTIAFLQQLGVSLKDAEGSFVGPYEAAQRLGKAFADLPAGSTKFIQIAEELGGFRQIGKVIPLIQQAALARKALNTANEGGASLDADVAKRQQTIQFQLQKTREEFYALIRAFTEDAAFQAFAKSTLAVARSLISLADAIRPLVPLLGALAVPSLLKGGAGLLGGIKAGKFNTGGKVLGFNKGGYVPGAGNRDTVPAMLTPGEFVIKKSSVNSIGAGTLEAMNNNKYATGGIVSLNPYDKGKPDIKRTSADITRGAVEGKAKKSTKEVNDIITYAKEKNILEGDLKTMFGGQRAKKLKVDLVGTSIGDAQVGKKTERLIRADFKKSVNSRGEAIADFFKPDKGSVQKPKKIKDKQLDDLGIASVIGNAFEAILGTIGAPFKEKGGNQSAFDFAGGVGENIAKKLGAKELANSPTDAKRTLTTKELKAVGTKKYPNYLADQLEFIDSKVKEEKIAEGLKNGQIKQIYQTQKSVTTADGRVGNLLGLSPYAVEKLRKENRFQSIGVGPAGAAGKTRPVGRNTGGKAPNSQDTVPAMLTPGEFVINAKSARSIGYGNLRSMNSKGVQGFNKGGVVGVKKFANGGTAGGGGALAALGGPLGAALLAMTALNTVVDMFSKTTEATTKEQKEQNAVIKRNAAVGKTLVTALGALVLGTIAANKAIASTRKGLDKLKKGIGNIAKGSINKDRQNFLNENSGDLGKKNLRNIDSFSRQTTKGRGGFGARKDVRKATLTLFKDFDKLARVQTKLSDGTKRTASVTQRLKKAESDLKESVIKRGRALGVVRKEEEKSIRANKSSAGTLRGTRKVSERLTNSLNKTNTAARKAEFNLKKFNRQMGKTRRGQIGGAIGGGARRLGGGAIKGIGGLAKGGGIGLLVGGLAATAVAISGFERARSELDRKRSEIASESGEAGKAGALGKRSVERRQTSEFFTLSGFFASVFGGSDFRKAQKNEATTAGIDASIAAVGSQVNTSVEKRQQQRKSGKPVEELGVFAQKSGRQIQDAAEQISSGLRRGDISAGQAEKKFQELAQSSTAAASVLGKEASNREELNAVLASFKTDNEDLNTALKNAAKAAFAAAQALEATAEAQFDSLKLSSTFNAANVAVKSFLGSLEPGASSMASFITTIEASAKDIGIDAAPAIERVRDQLKSDLAGTGLEGAIDRQADNALAGNKFSRSIGARLSGVDLSQDTDKKEAQIRAQLFKGLGNSESDRAIKAQIENVLSKTDFNSLDLNKVIQDIQKGVGTLSDGLTKAANLQAAHNATMTGLYKKREQIEKKAADVQIKAIDIQLKAAEIFESAGGAKLTLGQKSQARVAQFNELGSLGGVRLRSGSAEDINRTAAQINSKLSVLQNADLTSRSVVDRGGSGVFSGPKGVEKDERPELLAAQSQLIKTTQQQIKIRQEELKIIQQKNAAEKSALEKLISGDVSGFIEQQEAAGAAAALETGDAGLARLFGAGALGAGFNDLQKRGEATTGSAEAVLGAFGINDKASAGVLAGETPEMQALNSEIRNLAQALGDQAQSQASFAKSNIEIQKATINITEARYNKAIQDTSGNVTNRWMGGTVYASTGAFIPRGTDTVPAMLTPGEFVVNRNAVQTGNNLQVLRAMNSGAGSGASGQGGMSGGGSVGYYQFGGVVEAITSAFGGGVTGLMSAFGNFNQSVEKLSNLTLTVTIPDTNIRVNVDALNISGLREQIVDEVMDKVGRDISNTKLNNTGDITMATSLLPKIA